MEDEEVEDGLSEEQIVDRCYVFIMSDDMSNVKLALILNCTQLFSWQKKFWIC